MTGYKNAPHITPQVKQRLITKSKTSALFIDEACQACGGKQYAPADSSVVAAFTLHGDGRMEAGPFKCLSCGGPIAVRVDDLVRTVDGVETTND